MKSFKNAIKENKSSAKSADKKTMPIIEMDMDDVISEFIRAQAAEKAAKVEKEFAANQLIEAAREVQDAEAFAGRFSKSYQLKSSSGVVKYVTADKFSVSQDEKELRRNLGKKYAKLIQEKIEVSLRPEVFSSTEMQKELMKRMGDAFATFFEVTSTLATVPDFDKKIYDHVTSDEELAEIRTMVKQSKPSIR